MHLTTSACADRDEIIAYTIELFGTHQAGLVADHFAAALEAIATMPGVGRSKPELDPPGRAFLHLTVLRTWIVVYEVGDESIHVARILHGARWMHTGPLADEGMPGPDTSDVCVSTWSAPDPIEHERQATRRGPGRHRPCSMMPPASLGRRHARHAAGSTAADRHDRRAPWCTSLPALTPVEPPPCPRPPSR